MTPLVRKIWAALSWSSAPWRNGSRSGSSAQRSTAMSMVGHKTEAIYRRYAITDEPMLREGGARLEALHAVQNAITPPIAPTKPTKAAQQETKRRQDSGPVGRGTAGKLVAWDGVEPPTRGFSGDPDGSDHSDPNSAIVTDQADSASLPSGAEPDKPDETH